MKSPDGAAPQRVVDAHLFLLFLPHPEIRNGNLKSILGLFFILSRYKQQQQQQQQYYQSLVELSQQTSSTAPSASSLKTQEMQSGYVAPPDGWISAVRCWFGSRLGAEVA